MPRTLQPEATLSSALFHFDHLSAELVHHRPHQRLASRRDWTNSGVRRTAGGPARRGRRRGRRGGAGREGWRRGRRGCRRPARRDRPAAPGRLRILRRRSGSAPSVIASRTWSFLPFFSNSLTSEVVLGAVADDSPAVLDRHQPARDSSPCSAGRRARPAGRAAPARRPAGRPGPPARRWRRAPAAGAGGRFGAACGRLLLLSNSLSEGPSHTLPGRGRSSSSSSHRL